MNFIKNRTFKDFAIVIAILIITTIIFHTTNLDIIAQKWFFSPEKGWSIEHLPFWDSLYRFGIFPGYLLAIGALVTITLSYWSEKYLQFRKAAYILVFAMVVGPGLLVNLVGKDQWGRPRPREIIEFGGKEQFVKVGMMGDYNEGKSFPCGHASMGFFMALPYLFYRNRKKIVAISYLLFGLTYGMLIGLARMMAGGHFLSDVIWAGGVVWLAGLIGYYLFQYEKPIKIVELSNEEARKKAKRTTWIVGIILPIITLGLVLATPYSSKKSVTVSIAELQQANTKSIHATLKDATVEINNDTCFRANYAVNAFGFPNSKVRGRFRNGEQATYEITNMGWFTEVKNNISLSLPMNEPINYTIHVDNGKIFCNLADNTKGEFSLSIKQGDIHLLINKNDILLVGQKENIINKAHRPIEVSTTKNSKKQKCVIIFDVKNGKLIID